MIVLGLDFEGINANIAKIAPTDRVSEIGAVLWDWEEKKPVKIFSELINEADHPPITEELVKITGITEDMLVKWGWQGEAIRGVVGTLNWMMNVADCVMAHNGKVYDYPMCCWLFERYGCQMPQKLWIDSSKDIEFNITSNGRSMDVLEYHHGFINPFKHRAIFDSLAMLKIASNYDINRLIQMASSPIIRIIADFNYPQRIDYRKDAVAEAERHNREMDEFNRIKGMVKKAKFTYDQSIWYRDERKLLLDEGKLKFEFPIKVLDS